MKTNYRCMREGEAATEAAATPLMTAAAAQTVSPPHSSVAICCSLQAEWGTARQTEGDCQQFKAKSALFVKLKNSRQAKRQRAKLMNTARWYRKWNCPLGRVG